MKTDRLYYTDCYLKNFSAQVLDVSPDGRKVYLDRSAFYPASGGQPFDLGTLAGRQVLDVTDEEERVVHTVAEAVAAGTTVECQVDWARRYDHMQQHTGQHLLSAVFIELFGFETVSFHMGEEVSTIELAAKDVSESQLAQAEDRTNEVARSVRPVRILFEDASTATGLRKQSQRAGVLRIVEIEGVDKSACGGTHVRHLGETLPVQLRRTEKLRGNVRVEFVCGARAIRRARQDFRIVQDLARITACPPDKLAAQLTSMKTRLSDAEKERQQLQQDLAQREGREAYSAALPDSGGVRRIRWDVEQINETVRARCLAFAAGGQAVALAIGQQPAVGVLIACSTDAGLDAGQMLKDSLAEFGGRGGGSSTLAQGSLPDQKCAELLAAKLLRSN